MSPLKCLCMVKKFKMTSLYHNTQGNSTLACSCVLDIEFIDNIFTQQQNSGFY
jgi:hypothetical protein